MSLAVGGDVALPDAGALADPLVGGVDGFGQIVVGHDALRQIAAAAERPTDHAVAITLCLSAASGASAGQAAWRSVAQAVADAGR